MHLLQTNQQFAFCHAPVCSVRSTDSDRSEMISQLVFGETVEVLEQSMDWIRIKSIDDGYEGLVDRRHLCGMTLKEIEEWNGIKAMSTQFATELLGPSGSQQVPAGSFMGPQIDFKIGNFQYHLKTQSESIFGYHFAKSLINIPYLWGGKTSFGMDCSGFTQMVYRSLNINLPRDAYQQQLMGRSIEWKERKPLDLVFFQNERQKINHVGLLWSNDEIIHASGRVRIDTLTDQHIFNQELGKITHQFHSVIRCQVHSEFI